MSYQYYEVLTLQPDFSNPPSHGIDDTRDELASNDAPGFVAWQSDTVRLLSFDFQTHIPEEWRVFREFFDRTAGRARAFYLPSWEHDFVVAVDADQGDMTLTVVGHWHSTNLTENRPDTIGRRLFVYNHLGAFATYWVTSAAASGGNDVLTLDTPLVEALEADRCVLGFCYMVRLLEDTIATEHTSPGHVAAKLSFRQIRQSRRVNQQESAPSDAIGTLRGNDDILAEDLDPLYDDLLTTSTIGPDVYGTAQANAFEAEWDVAYDRATNLVRYTGAGVRDSTLWNGLVAPRQITATFDAVSREVLAWEYEAQVTIARVVGSSAAYLTFPGYSPVAFTTAAIDGASSISSATVVVFYLRPRDSTIYCRISTDNFANVHRFCVSPVAPMYLYRVIRDGNRMVIVGMDTAHRRARWRSNIYPGITPATASVSTFGSFALTSVFQRVDGAVFETGEAALPLVLGGFHEDVGMRLAFGEENTTSTFTLGTLQNKAVRKVAFGTENTTSAFKGFSLGVKIVRVLDSGNDASTSTIGGFALTSQLDP